MKFDGGDEFDGEVDGGDGESLNLIDGEVDGETVKV